MNKKILIYGMLSAVVAAYIYAEQKKHVNTTQSRERIEIIDVMKDYKSSARIEYEKKADTTYEPEIYILGKNINNKIVILSIWSMCKPKYESIINTSHITIPADVTTPADKFENRTVDGVTYGPCQYDNITPELDDNKIISIRNPGLYYDKCTLSKMIYTSYDVSNCSYDEYVKNKKRLSVR